MPYPLQHHRLSVSTRRRGTELYSERVPSIMDAALLEQSDRNPSNSTTDMATSSSAMPFSAWAASIHRPTLLLSGPNSLVSPRNSLSRPISAKAGFPDWPPPRWFATTDAVLTASLEPASTHQYTRPAGRTSPTRRTIVGPAVYIRCTGARYY